MHGNIDGDFAEIVRRGCNRAVDDAVSNDAVVPTSEGLILDVLAEVSDLFYGGTTHF